MLTKEEIFVKIKDILIKDFEIEEDKIVPEASLFEDLELDSIDAVDLAVKVQQFTNKKMTPNDFKQIKTMDDVAQTVRDLICK